VFIVKVGMESSQEEEVTKEEKNISVPLDTDCCERLLCAAPRRPINIGFCVV